jgi:hypothetical protein
MFKRTLIPLKRFCGFLTGLLDLRTIVLMNDLLETPNNFYKHVRRTTASIACILVFGQRAASYEAFWGHVSTNFLSLLEIVFSIFRTYQLICKIVCIRGT